MQEPNSIAQEIYNELDATSDGEVSTPPSPSANSYTHIHRSITKLMTRPLDHSFFSPPLPFPPSSVSPLPPPPPHSYTPLSLLIYSYVKIVRMDILTYSYTRTRARVLSRTHMHRGACRSTAKRPVRTHALIHKNLHACRLTYSHIHTHSHTHSHARSYVQVSPQDYFKVARVHPYTHT